MNGIEAFASEIIGAALICTIIEIIVPKNSGQVINIVTGLFMLTVIVAPLKTLTKEIKDFKPTVDIGYSQSIEDKKLIDKINGYTAQSGADAVRDVFNELLKGFGVENGNVIINYEIDEKNNVINITSAVIQLDERYKSRGSQIETYLFRNTNIPVEVKYKG